MTLAVEFVNPKTDLSLVLQHLLERVKELGIPFKSLFLDKGFCSIPIMATCSPKVYRFCWLPPSKARKAVPGRSATAGAAISPNTPSQPEEWPTDRPRRGRAHFRQTSAWSSQSTVVGVRLVEHARSPYPRRPQNLSPTFRNRVFLPHDGKSAPPHHFPQRCPALPVHGPALILLNIWIALQWTYLRIQGSGPRRVANQYSARIACSAFYPEQSRPFILSLRWSTHPMLNLFSQNL